jgi:hypothetical protein
MGVLFLRLLAPFAFAVVATASWAQCPYGTAYADGCSAAPTANADTIEVPNFFTGYAQQNGQTYATRPPWNVAGVDYPVGINSSYAASLMDPSTVPLPTGCNFIGGALPYVKCANVNNLNISGYDFGHTAVGSVGLYIGAGVTGTLTISNNKFFNGPTLDPQYFDVNIGTVSANVVMSYNYFDGNGVGIPQGDLASIVLDEGLGSLTFQYNAIVNVPSKALSYFIPGANVNISYNYGEGLNFGSGAHSEFTIGNTGGSEEIGYNTFLVDKNNAGGTANIFADNGSAGGTVLNADIDHNVDVSNYDFSYLSYDNPNFSPITSAFLIGPGGQTFDNISITDNYFDPNGSYRCVSPFFTAVTETFSGNVDMIDGSSVDESTGGCTFAEGGIPPSGPIVSGGTGGVPEPPKWAMMFMGFVVVGCTSLWRRSRGVAVMKKTCQNDGHLSVKLLGNYGADDEGEAIKQPVGRDEAQFRNCTGWRSQSQASWTSVLRARPLRARLMRRSGRP